MNDGTVTSVDVYDAASSIGLECQSIICEYGPEILYNLMPKVISALEDLEACALYHEKENEEVGRLRELLEALRVDCRVQTGLKDKINKSLEQLERSWYSETQQLLEQVANLEAENNRLAQELVSGVHTASPLATEKLTVGSVLVEAAAGRTIDFSQNSVSLSKTKDPLGTFLEDVSTNIVFETDERLQLTEQESRAADLQLIGRLKECVSANCKAVRSLNRELLYSNVSLDAAEEEVCRLARQSGQLMACRPNCFHPIDALLSERDLLQQQLLSREQDVAKLQDVLRCTGDTNLQLTDSQISHCTSHEVPFSCTWLASASDISTSGRRRTASIVGDHPPPRSDDKPADLTDFDRISSLEELRRLLCERNDLRCRLIEVEEQLHIVEQENARTPEPQGPLPREPVEKLRPDWQEKPSIKVIFRKLLARLTDTSSE